jgi:hypothetical protein
MLLTGIARALVESLEAQEEFEVILRGPVLVGTDLTEVPKRPFAPAPNSRARSRAGCRLSRHPRTVARVFSVRRVQEDESQAHESILAKARLAVQAQLDSALTDPNADGVDVVLETGTPHVGLLRQAEQIRAGVVVVWPGSAATDVVRHAGTAVLVARRSPRGPVVGASDFSDPSLPAFARGCRRGAAPWLAVSPPPRP